MNMNEFEGKRMILVGGGVDRHLTWPISVRWKAMPVRLRYLK